MCINNCELDWREVVEHSENPTPILYLEAGNRKAGAHAQSHSCMKLKFQQPDCQQVQHVGEEWNTKLCVAVVCTLTHDITSHTH